MDYELIGWIVIGIISVISYGVLMAIAKRESENYVDWIPEIYGNKK